MNPHQLLGFTGPANNFAMGGLPMHFANILIVNGKQMPQTLFMDIMVEKTEILIKHVNNHHLGLCLTTNIGNNSAVICVYDNFCDYEHTNVASNYFKLAKYRNTALPAICRSNGHTT